MYVYFLYCDLKNANQLFKTNFQCKYIILSSIHIKFFYKIILLGNVRVVKSRILIFSIKVYIPQNSHGVHSGASSMIYLKNLIPPPLITFSILIL